MIEIKNLSKNYGQTEIFDHMSFTFPNEGLVCILGASGCGKSTLLNILAGFDSDYTGDIRVMSSLINKMSTSELCSYRRDNIGFIFQNYHLLSGYTVLENIGLATELNTSSMTENEEAAIKLLDKLGLTEKTTEKVENLSGGQKQRVAIARALINSPSVLLADEPTGALDRKTSTEIMMILKELSKDRLVIVITHDSKCAEFADLTVAIEDGKLVTQQAIPCIVSKTSLRKNSPTKVSVFRRGLKNYKVHLSRYIAVSMAISIGILCFILSLSSGNIIEKSIEEFQEKNTAFNNGYIKVEDDEKRIIEALKGDKRIENIYEQYVINNISLTLDGTTELMVEKYPTPKAIKKMSYGTMPKDGKNEIAISPSLAAKFGGEIKNLLGKTISLEYMDEIYPLTIRGIFNAEYDDIIISSDVEQKFYQKEMDGKVYSVSYDVTEFEDIVGVSTMLKENGFVSQNASAEVAAFQTTFQNLNHLFLTLSIIILSVCVFISAILLVKLQNSRYREIGLLSALGYTKSQIRNMVLSENILLSGTAALLNFFLVVIACMIGKAIGYGIIIELPQFLASIVLTVLTVIGISFFASIKLISTEPAKALRMR